MKIAIIGFSGSGKSTLAHAISKKHSLPLLHLDRAHWLPNWVERDKGEREEIVKDFLDANSSWVIDGNYAKVFYERRLCEADTIIIMRFGALACLFRAIKRKKEFKGKSRPSMTEGCDERINKEFFWWLVHGSRTRDKKHAFDEVAKKYKNKTIIIKNQRALDAYYKAQGLTNEV